MSKRKYDIQKTLIYVSLVEKKFRTLVSLEETSKILGVFSCATFAARHEVFRVGHASHSLYLADR